jgi:hypothetical protein
VGHTVFTPCYLGSDEKGIDNLAGRTGQDVNKTLNG